MRRGRRSLVGGVPALPPATTALLFPDALASAISKVSSGTSQALSFQSQRATNLNSIIESSYYYDQIGEEAVACAILYRCLRDSDSTTALKYAGKAIGLALSMKRDSHRGSNGPYQFIGQGDGVTTTFSLPGTVVSSSLTVYSGTLTSTPIVKGASGGMDNLGLYNSLFQISKIVKLVSTNSLSVSATWNPTTDYNQVAFKDTNTLAEEVIDWSPVGSEPSVGATYFVISCPVGSGLSQVTNFTTGTSTITFNTAPAVNQAIFVSCLYNSTTYKQLQSGNGLGGLAILRTADNLYPMRYIGKAIGIVFDYCYDELLSPEVTELGDFLVSCSDLSRDTTYAPAEWVESNYGAGNYINRIFAAVALQGRHTQATRLQTEVESLYTSSTTIKFVSPATNKSSLNGGFPGEGLSSYGQETTEHILLGTAALAYTNWDISPVFPLSDLGSFASSVIRFNLHARYSEIANVRVPGETRPGSVYEGGDNGYYPCPSVSKRIFAIASGLTSDTVSGSYARYLITNKTGDIVYDGWDLLFRDGVGSMQDWGADVNFGTTYNCTGRGIYFARSDWTYASPWIAFAAGNRGDCDHDEPGAGDLTIYRGEDKLVASAMAIGERYNDSPSAAWSNVIVVDDTGANLQTNRWGSTNVFSNYQGIVRPGIAPLTIDESNGHYFVTTDYSAIYAKDNTTNPVTALKRSVVFLPSTGYIFVYDRCTTSGSTYPKHLRYHKEESTHPIGSGTVTITNSSSSTAPLPWDASAAVMQAAIRGLTGTGFSSCTVTTLCDGYWIVTFTAGITISNLGGSSNVSGGAIEIYDFHPEGASGAKTIQHIVLSKVITGTQQLDLGSSRMFRRVDSSDSLTRTECLIDAGQFTSGLLCRRLSFRQSTTSATARYATFIQITTAPTTEVTNSFLTGSGTKLQGYRAGTQVVLFCMTDTFSPPDTITITSTGTLSWHVFGLTPNTIYDITNATTTSVTTNSNGVAFFTTTGANPSVVISTHVVIAAVYAHILDNPGIATVLASRYTSEASARPTSVQWRWMNSVRPDPLGSNLPHVVIGHHSYAVNPGHFIFKNTSTTGGAIVFTDVTNTDYAVTNAFSLGGCGGLTVSMDIDGDGDVDHITCVDTSTSLNSAWLLDASNHLINSSGINISGQSNYIDYLADTGDGTGLVDVVTATYPIPSSFTSLASQRLVTLTNNGTSFSVTSNIPYPIPSGVPGAVTTALLAVMQSATVDKGRFVCFYLDIDNDGTDELIIAAYISYESQKNKYWVLKDTGGGSYTDMTVTWGLPPVGTFIHLMEPGMMPRVFQTSNHLHKSIDGTGAPHIFIAGGPLASGGSPGMYRWNGAGFTKQLGAVTTRLSDAMVTGSSTGDPDNYLVNLTACDLTNSGRLDLAYHRPLGSMFMLFLNNGSGVFTQYSTGSSAPWSNYPCWGPYGQHIVDANNDGKLDILLGGKNPSTTGGGHGSQPAGISQYAAFRNNTSNPGNYLKVYLRRSTTLNKHGIGGTVGCYTAGTSNLIRQWRARHDGEAVHFGLGSAATIDVWVTWPNGTLTKQLSVATNQTITFTN